MVKRIIFLGAIVITVFCVCSNNVLAAQKEVKDDMNSKSEKILKEIVEEEVRKYEEAEIDKKELIEEYKNLEITLPEEFFYEDGNSINEDYVEDVELDTLGITTYASTTALSGIYTLGTATSTNLLYGMSTALSYLYTIESTVTTTYYIYLEID